MPIVKRSSTTKRRKPSRKRQAALRAERRRATKKQATIDKQLALQSAATKLVIDGCQHPRTRARGCCVRPAILDDKKSPILFTIPDAYIPQIRHALQPSLPRPVARLCVQHKYLVDGFLEADERPKDFPHRSQCPVCRHPKADGYVEDWITHSRTATQCARLMDVSINSFMKHCFYYGYDEKRADKVNTRRFLQRVMDEGIERGGATIKDALAAEAQLAKERGDAVNVDMRMVVRDLSNLSDKELAKEMKAAAIALEAGSKEQSA